MARKKKKQFAYKVSVLVGAIGQIFKSPIVISWVLSIAGLIILAAMSVPKLRATQVSPADVHVVFENPPVWLDASLLQELQDIARLHLAQKTVGREGLIQTADALGATGWFRVINQVRWTNEHHAVIDATFLVPHAKVLDDYGESFIDIRGRRLPTRDGAIANDDYHYIALIHPQSNRPQRAGLQWNGKDIMAGLKVLQLIYNKPWASQVKAINLSRWSANGSMTLETDTPSYLIWGSTPGEEHGLEALADHKIERLDYIFSKYERIDQNLTAEFDLTDATRVTRN
jgi:hypothetical protein